jgi:adenine phosphoribosyltransferase
MSPSSQPSGLDAPSASGRSSRVEASAPSRGAGSLRPPLGTGGGERLRALIREIPDFPRPGIAFKDITPLLADPSALAEAVRMLADYARPLRVDCVVAAEARGFLLGPALAVELGAGFVLARKPGKLPYETVSAEYLLEYGAGQLELHTDAVHSGKRVLIHDDLLATGGTAKALCELVDQLGGEIVGCGFLIELAFLSGRERLAPHEAHALLTYES